MYFSQRVVYRYEPAARSGHTGVASLLDGNLYLWGGLRISGGDILHVSPTALGELSEYILQYSSYSDRHCTVVLVYCRHKTAPLPMQSREEMVSGWWGG